MALARSTGGFVNGGVVGSFYIQKTSSIISTDAEGFRIYGSLEWPAVPARKLEELQHPLLKT